MDSKSLYEKIDKIRDDRKWTMYRLAQESGISESTLYSWRDRGTMPTLIILNALSEALGVSIVQILSDDADTYKLSEEQKEILGKMSLLSKKQRQSVFALIESFTEAQN